MAVRTVAASLGLLAAFAVPLGAQADSVAPDSARRVLSPVTLGSRAPARSIGSLRQSVDSTDFATGAPARTLSELLQARLPGVSVLRFGGDPAEGSRVRVRGTTSLVGDPGPVLVLDGLPVSAPEALGSSLSLAAASRFDDFDPDEVERIDVLSGPAATTLFGVGASNGAIVITTKRGATGAPRWRAWSHGSLSGESTQYPANYRRNGTDPTTGAAADNCDVAMIAIGRCVPTTLDVWNPLESASPFQAGRYGAGGASLAGGPFGVRGYASALGRVEAAMLDDSRSSRMNGRLNAEREFFGQLTIAGSVGYVRRHATTRGDPTVLNGLIGTAVDDADRGYRSLRGIPLPPTDRRGDRVSRSARVEWRALSWLRVHGTAGRDEVTQRDLLVLPPPDIPVTVLPQARELTTRHWLASSVIHGTAETHHRLGGSMGLRTLVSYEESSRRSLEEEFNSAGTFSYRSARWGTMRSWLFQERIDFRERVFLNVGARRVAEDRSDNGATWHPSVDLSWGVGRLPVGPAVRLRGAYAVGVQPRDTGFVGFLLATPPPLTTYPIGVPSPQAAPIEPEQPREAEIGFDASWGTRLELNLTVYDQRTPKLIVIGPAPQPSAGALAARLGKIQNRGVELLGRVRLFDGPAARWDATMTFAALRNRVGGLDAFPPRVFTGAGVRNDQPFPVFLTRDVTFVDANGDNLPAPSELTISDFRPFAPAVPTREASLRSELGLPRWGLAVGVALDHRAGHRAMNLFDYYQCFGVANCRALEDPSVSLADKVEAVAARYRGVTSLYLEDATYTRLREVALAWTPPARFGRAISNGLRVTVEGRNLVTWTRFNGPDPEVATANAREGSPRLPALPALPRTIGVRIDVAAR